MSPLSRLRGLLRKKKPADAAPPPSIAPVLPPPFFPDAGPSARITLYVETWCSDSRKAERHVLEKGWPTHRENLKDRHEEKVRRLKEAGIRSLPIVYLDGKPLGGLQALLALKDLPA